MFKKIKEVKDIFKVKDSVDNVRDSISDLNKSVQSLTKDVKELKKELNDHNKEITELKKANAQLHKEFNEIIRDIKEHNSEFKDQIRDFKLTKSRMQDTILNDLSSNMRDLTKTVKTDLQDYYKINKSILDTNEEMQKNYSQFQKEIEKFNKISGTIREVDFELNKYAAKLERNEIEKMKLLKEIDNLQNIIAKNRQQKTQNRFSRPNQ